MRTTLCLLACLAATGAARAAGSVACDGGDATAAIQAALAGSGVVRLSAGVCLVSSSLFVGSRTALRGAGIGVTILRAAQAPPFGMVVIGGSTLASGASDVEIADLSVDGGATGGIGPKGSSAITSNWSSRSVRIHDVEAYAAGMNGIEVHGSDVAVERDRVHDNQANGIYVIGRGHPGQGDAVPASRVRIAGNAVANNSRGKTEAMRHGWDGIDLDGATRDCVIEGNTVTGNDIIVFENGQVTPESIGHRIIGNTVSDVVQGNAGIDVIGPQVGFEVLGNTIRGVRGVGIVVNGPARDGAIRDNSVSGASQSGIQIRDTGPMAARDRPRRLRVEGNTVVAGAGQHAIEILHGAIDVQLVGNHLRGDGSVALIDRAGAGAGLVVRDDE